MDLGLRDQHYISQQRRLPTDDLGSDKGVTAPSETVQLYYYNAGALTSDAGQAAGTVCVGKFAYRNIRNAIGDVVGTFLDTSMAFTSTAFTTEKAFPLDVAEKNDQLTGTTKAAAITSGYSNGDYCIDYRTGAVYGIKASTQTSLTSCMYKIETSTSITPGIFTASNDITHIGGIAVPVDNATASATPTVLMTGAVYKNALDTYADNDATPIPVTANGVPITALTSGATLTPIFDTAGHAGFSKITDGTLTTSVTAAYAETLALATDFLNVGGLCYGIDANNATPILAAMQVAADNTTISATPNTLIVGGIYKNADDTYGDNDAVPFHFTASGELRTAGGSSVSSEYRATTNGQDGTAVYLSGTTLTIAGTPFTINNEDLVYIREVDSTGNTASLWVNGQSGVHMEISAGTLTRSGGSAFSSNGVYEVGYNGQDKAYNSATDSNQTTETSPVHQRFIGETLAAITNGTDGTYYYYVDMSGYKKSGFQFILSGGSGTCTCTLEGTLENNGTAAASCAYIDITQDIFGLASITANDMWIDDTGVLGQFKYARIKVVAATGAANDADWEIFHKRLF